jgi:membrane-associated phospholipid phosphatase
VLTRLLLGLAAFVLVGWLAGELWVSIIGSSEADAMRSLAEQRSETLIEAARVITWAGSALVLVPLAVVYCLVLARAGLWREAATVALSLGGAMLIYELTKTLTSRPRPSVEHLQAVSGSSFPSGHATQASAFWLSLVLVLRATRVQPFARRMASALATALVLGVAWSRVYLGVHYPSDVVAGVVLGSGWALWVRRCLSPSAASPSATQSAGADVRQTPPSQP